MFIMDNGYTAVLVKFWYELMESSKENPWKIMFSHGLPSVTSWINCKLILWFLKTLSPGPIDPKTPGVGHLDYPHGAPFWLTFTMRHKLPSTSRNRPKDTCHRFKSRTVGIGPASHFQKKNPRLSVRTMTWRKKNTSKLRNNMRCKMYQNVHQLQ